ncbi:MAG: DNA mismatch repair protein MutL [uncultured Gemmatimonadaceae bacterium]|uniref:DNA mismatch repair protein MutL n=1 Tax=uncultured Gemmatimonadaceae bacterium TaxID=246130 RepID=A0A6J4KVK4_9BACT|nr:MAG: DNA mismatch repair protein MutL [uncultured Gemmatimonadaceae bacterium]
MLPSAVADQIAAGEVVERPASVVKELVENALDAGATALDVAVEDGGRGLIRVSDDGCGMDRGDAVLALARHATSKIRAAADLVGVATFGFRGEALPAICSVAELTIETATLDGHGTRIRASGGAVLDVADAARRRGTTVSVARLFHTVPARAKFLRSARSEWRAVADALTTIALGRCDVRLAVTHDGRPTLTLPPAPSLRARVGGVWGTAAAESLVAVDDVAGPVRTTGLVERPSDVGTTTRRVYVTVNGRAVRDAGLVRAAELAYRSTIGAGLRPTLFLAVELPGDLVDVNVHPAKAEVRFRDRWPVERAVEAAVRRALGGVESAPSLGVRIWPAPAPAVGAVEVDVEVLRPAADRAGALFAGGPALAVADEPDEAPRAPDEAGPAVPPLLQLRRTYIMFERDEGVVLIDQHSAHERVLFEQFMAQLSKGDAPSQRLLFPLTLHLGPEEGDAFDASRGALERLGYEVESFGGHTLLVRAVPAPHPRFDAERCLRDTLSALAGGRDAGTAARHERLAATVACKAAVKAGDALSAGEMRALYLALGGTTLPAHDVHGRSTIVQLGWDELERRFGRR